MNNITRKPVRRTRHKDVLLESLSVSGARLIDIGCGAGAVTRMLARAGARAVGVEIDAARVAAARAADPDGLAEYVEGRGEALPFADGAVDVALYFNALHHVPRAALSAALAEAARVLRPGGALYVSEPMAEGDYYKLCRPVDDECAVYAAVREKLAAPDLAQLFEPPVEDVFETPFIVKDFEAFAKDLMSVDPARAALFARQRPFLEAAFPHFGESAENGGRRFWTPNRNWRFIRRNE